MDLHATLFCLQWCWYSKGSAAFSFSFFLILWIFKCCLMGKQCKKPGLMDSAIAGRLVWPHCPWAGCRGLLGFYRIKDQFTFCLVVTHGILCCAALPQSSPPVWPHFLWTANKMTSSVTWDLCAVVLNSLNDNHVIGMAAESLFLLKCP